MTDGPARPPSFRTDAPLPAPDVPRLAELLERCDFEVATPTAADESPKPSELHVAVSGGPDSTALLALAISTGAEVVAHHVDHGLRDQSAAEAGFVESLCAHWGAGFTGHAAELEDGPDLERRCREARMEVLPQGCLTGHTADDQAETVLMRLMRGTGPLGLSAMAPATHPMLGLRRAETAALCSYLGVQPVQDPANEDPRFTRNRVRHELLPLMGDIAGRDVVPLLARTAALAAQTSGVLGELVDGVDPTDTASVTAAPTPVAAEALRRYWRVRTGGLMPPDRAAVERMLAVARGERRSTEVAAGWTMRRRTGRLWLEAGVPDADAER